MVVKAEQELVELERNFEINILCKKSEFFKQIIKGIHTYCISTTRYTTMTHKECIDFMVYEFVPSNLWNSLRENQKNKLFHESITNCITIFTEKIITNHLHIIIDHRDQPDNITILQDLFLSIILFEKDKIFSKFLNPNNKDSNNLELFRDKIKHIVNEKKQLIEDNKKLENKLKLMDNLVKKNAEIITELQKNNKLLIKKIELYKVDNIRLKLTINDINNKKTNNNFKNNNSERNSEKNSDNDSIKNSDNNDSDNQSVKSNDSINIKNYFEVNNSKQNKELFKFIKKKDNKITSELIFDDDNIDDYDQ
jgi:hypothetical protein